MEAIIVALITAIGGISCQVIINLKGKKSTLIEQARKDQALEDRLKSIEEKLDIHNGYAEKFGEIGDKFQSISESLIALQKDIEYLREIR